MVGVNIFIIAIGSMVVIFEIGSFILFLWYISIIYRLWIWNCEKNGFGFAEIHKDYDFKGCFSLIDNEVLITEMMLERISSAKFLFYKMLGLSLICTQRELRTVVKVLSALDYFFEWF